MKFNTKKIAVLFSTALILATSLGKVTTTFANSTQTSADQTEQTNAPAVNSTENTAKTQASSLDTEAIKQAMYAEINNLRSQNGLNSVTTVGVLNSYAQERVDGFAGGSGIDNHVGWNSAKMVPYNLTAEENIAQLPISAVSSDPTEIAKTITEEFYNEKNDAIPNYGHRKNMLNPYVHYIGFGVAVANGMIYFSQEIGNDATSAAQSTFKQRNDYYVTNSNDYANVSQYDAVDADRKNSDAAQDYVQNGNSYTYVDVRGGVSTRDSNVKMYDRNGSMYTNLSLAPGTDWASDIISIINGNYFFHVSTNGFVKAEDVTPWASFLAGQVVTAAQDAAIYDDYGNATTRRVNAGSAWQTDRRSIDFSSNNKFYRIGTNAWLKESDLTNALN